MLYLVCKGNQVSRRFEHLQDPVKHSDIEQLKYLRFQKLIYLHLFRAVRMRPLQYYTNKNEQIRE